MINSKRLAWTINKTEKVHITDIDSGKSFETSVCKYDRSKKIFGFENSDNGLEIHRNKIKMISRLETVPDKFMFYIELYSGKRYKLELFMKEGFTPFAVTPYERKNISDVQKVIPKYLDSLKGKQIIMSRTSANAVFSTWNIDENSENHIVTDNYIVSDFNYDFEVVDGIIVLKMFDNSNNKIYSTALNVTFVIGDKDKVFVSAKNGEYTLKILE